MQLLLDGITVTPRVGQSLLAIVRQEGLDCGELADRPIAAKIAGEVFNLNYIPLRGKDGTGERPSIRRAMAASGGRINLLRYRDPKGRDVYDRTAQAVIFMALQRCYPGSRAKMNSTVGNALYIEVMHTPSFSIQRVRQEIAEIVAQDIPFLRQRVDKSHAVEHFIRAGQTDKARLLSWRQESYFDQYVWGDFSDYYYGELAPSTGYLTVWDLVACPGGFLFLGPNDADPSQVAPPPQMPKLLEVISEEERWCELMECENVADLNEMVVDGRIRELIRVNEALHEKRYSQIADMACQRDAKIVMLSGPSSSGKTTSANRLATQLRVHGKRPIVISLDDYYRNREELQPGPDGEVDLEHINTIDTELFRRHVSMLLAGERVSFPHFNFLTGKREWRGRELCLRERTVLIVEGLHALNPVLLPERIPHDSVFRIFVSPQLPLNLDDHNRIPNPLLRLLRRTVRDNETRGYGVQQTMAIWDSVRRGEERWIVPFQEHADVMFNSATLYELAVLKKHIFPLLIAVEPEDPCYDAVRGIVKILNYVAEADVDGEIPPTSLVREFIGGNSFYL